jgi:putative hemolysin
VVNIHEPGPLEGRLDQWPVLAASGALEVRLAETEGEIEAAQRLRYHVFYEEMAAIPSPSMRECRRDFDKFDDFCDHILVVDRATTDDEGQPAVVGTYRMIRDVDAARAGGFYTAGEYDIGPMLTGMAPGWRLLELGRSCVLKSYRAKPITMQLLWRGLMSTCCSAARRCRESIPTLSHCRFRTCITSTALSMAPACGHGPSSMSR